MVALCRHLGSALTVLTLVSGLTACGGGDDEPGAAGPTGGQARSPRARFAGERADTVAKVSLRDFAIGGIEPTLRGPKVLFEASNQGPDRHELVVVDEDGRRLGRIPAFEPGTAARPLPLELKPGRYQAHCLVRRDDRTHAQLGMEVAFTVE